MSTQTEKTTIEEAPKPKPPRKRQPKKDVATPAPPVEPIESSTPAWADEPLYVPPVQMGEDEEVYDRAQQLVETGNAGYVPEEKSTTGYSLWDMVYTFLGGFVTGALGTLILNNYVEALEEQQFIEMEKAKITAAVHERIRQVTAERAVSDAPQEPTQP